MHGPRIVRPPESTSSVRPLQRQVERVAGRGDQARGAELDPLGPLRDRREQRDRVVARLREEAVADPDRVEAELLDPGREVEQVRERVVGRDQRLAVVEVDPELDFRGSLSSFELSARSLRSWSPRRVTAACSPVSSSTRCGTSMWSASRCPARSASPASTASRIAACSAIERLEAAAQLERSRQVAAHLVHQQAVHLVQLAVPRGGRRRASWNSALASKKAFTSSRSTCSAISRCSSRSRARSRLGSRRGTASRIASVSRASRTW